MYKYVSSGDFLLDQIIKVGKELTDIFRLGIKKREHDVFEGGLVGDMIEACCCGDDYLEGGVLVMMRWERMNSRSRAAWMSPMKMVWPW